MNKMLSQHAHLQPILINNVFLKTTRLCINILATTHLSSLAFYLLSLDFNQSDDPRIIVYTSMRWKLITSWFNLMLLVYLPISIYCDWRDLRGESSLYHVKIIDKLRHIWFNSTILPSTAFGTIIFWKLWSKDPEMLVPSAIEAYVPYWMQHSLHTVSLFVVVLNLILVPRKRPKNIFFELSILSVFVLCYSAVVFKSLLEREIIYPFLKSYDLMKIAIFVLYMYTEHVFYFACQWFIVDIVWGGANDVKSKIA